MHVVMKFKQDATGFLLASKPPPFKLCSSMVRNLKELTAVTETRQQWKALKHFIGEKKAKSQFFLVGDA